MRATFRRPDDREGEQQRDERDENGPNQQPAIASGDPPHRRASSLGVPRGLRPRGPSRHDQRLKTTEAFVPPNPKLLDITTSMGIRLAALGTRSRGVSTEGLSRLIVGGAI